MIKKLFHIMEENSWKSVFFTHKTEEYGRIKRILHDNGIKTKTKSFTPYDSSQLSSYVTFYDILVKTKDFHTAQEIIREKGTI